MFSFVGTDTAVVRVAAVCEESNVDVIIAVVFELTKVAEKKNAAVLPYGLYKHKEQRSVTQIKFRNLFIALPVELSNR